MLLWVSLPVGLRGRQSQFLYFYRIYLFIVFFCSSLLSTYISRPFPFPYLSVSVTSTLIFFLISLYSVCLSLPFFFSSIPSLLSFSFSHTLSPCCFYLYLLLIHTLFLLFISISLSLIHVLPPAIPLSLIYCFFPMFSPISLFAFRSPCLPFILLLSLSL